MKGLTRGNLIEMEGNLIDVEGNLIDWFSSTLGEHDGFVHMAQIPPTFVALAARPRHNKNC